MKTEYKITLDTYYLELISKAIKLEEKRNNHDSDTDEYRVIDDDLDDIYKEIGMGIIFDYKRAPF